MLDYLLEVTLCWAALYLVYVLVLSRETFFRYNRGYLLGALTAGLALPVLAEWLQTLRQTPVPLPELFVPIAVDLTAAADYYLPAAPTPEALSVLDVLIIVYWSGATVAAVRLALGLWEIYQTYRRRPKTRTGAFVLVELPAGASPYSFFHLVFWPASEALDGPQGRSILAHELVHVRQYHTLDVLFTELLLVFFWWNPLLYGFRRALRTVHEYLADAGASQPDTRRSYGRLLIERARYRLTGRLSHHFAQTQLKKRITMLAKKPSPRGRYGRYLAALPVLLLFVGVFMYKDSAAQLDRVAVTGLVTLDAQPAPNFTETLAAYLRTHPKPDHMTAGAVGRWAGDVHQLYLDAVAAAPGQQNALTDELVRALGTVQLQVETHETDGRRYPASIWGFPDHIDLLTEQPRSTERLYFEVDELSRPIGCTLGNADACTAALLKKYVTQYQAAKGTQLTGIAHVTAELTAAGTLEQIRVQPGTPPRLAAAAYAIANGLPEFVPAKVAGKAVRSSLDLRLVFGEAAPKVDNADAIQLLQQQTQQWLARKPDSYADWRAILAQGDVLVSEWGAANPEHLREGYAVVKNALDKTDAPVTPMLVDGNLHLFIHSEKQSTPVPTASDTTKVYRIAEVMPRFPGCEDQPAADRKACSDQRLMDYIRTNLRQVPATKASTKRTAVVSFVVETDGRLTEHKIMREAGEGRGAAALELVRGMPDWVPGTQAGKAVRVRYTIPVRFEDTPTLSPASGDGEQPTSEPMHQDLVEVTADPLFVIDGIITDRTTMRELNPENISAIAVLKGAKATEKYGAISQAGVIEITTKDGSPAGDIEIGAYPILVVVDGKKLGVAPGNDPVSFRQAVDPLYVRRVELYGGKRALKRYGADAAIGVLEITTQSRPRLLPRESIEVHAEGGFTLREKERACPVPEGGTSKVIVLNERGQSLEAGAIAPVTVQFTATVSGQCIPINVFLWQNPTPPAVTEIPVDQRVPNQRPEILLPDAQLTVAPNPATDEIQIAFELPLGVATITLLDSEGRALWSERAQQAPGTVYRSTKSVADLPAGTYYVRADRSDLLRVAMFIKQ